MYGAVSIPDVITQGDGNKAVFRMLSQNGAVAKLLSPRRSKRKMIRNSKKLDEVKVAENALECLLFDTLSKMGGHLLLIFILVSPCTHCLRESQTCTPLIHEVLTD